MVNYVGNSCLHTQRIHQNDEKECVGNYDNDNILKFKISQFKFIFNITVIIKNTFQAVLTP